jgi:hypothetical protein
MKLGNNKGHVKKEKESAKKKMVNLEMNRKEKCYDEKLYFQE